jgi:hypothetical protein
MFELGLPDMSRNSVSAGRSYTTLAVHAVFFAGLYMAALFASVASAQSTAKPLQKEYLKKLEGPIILRGDYFKAVQSAYSDFENELSKNARGALAADTPNKALAEWTSKIENYDIHITKTGETISIDFIPTVRGDFMPVLGGGAHYVVNGSSFRIESKLFSK